MHWREAKHSNSEYCRAGKLTAVVFWPESEEAYGLAIKDEDGEELKFADGFGTLEEAKQAAERLLGDCT